MFDEKFAAGLPEEAYEAAHTLCLCYNKFHKSNNARNSYDSGQYLNALAIAENLIESHKIEHPNIPSLTYTEGLSSGNVARITRFFIDWTGITQREVRRRTTKNDHESARMRFAKFFWKKWSV